MKQINAKSSVQKLLLFGITAMMLFYFSSCATKMSFLNSSVVPGADGTVKVKKDNNSNYDIKIELTNLADAGRLSPARNTYVVWMETTNNETKNIGQINSSKGFVTGKMKGSFETVSATKPTKIYITAEDAAGVQFPGTQIILTTKAF